MFLVYEFLMLRSLIYIPYRPNVCILFCFVVGKKSYAADAEEDQFTDLVLLMQLLTHILSKDYLDFSSGTTSLPLVRAGGAPGKFVTGDPDHQRQT